MKPARASDQHHLFSWTNTSIRQITDALRLLSVIEPSPEEISQCPVNTTGVLQKMETFKHII
jgi:hypothetical protein